MLVDNSINPSTSDFSLESERSWYARPHVMVSNTLTEDIYIRLFAHVSNTGLMMTKFHLYPYCQTMYSFYNESIVIPCKLIMLCALTMASRVHGLPWAASRYFWNLCGDLVVFNFWKDKCVNALPHHQVVSSPDMQYQTCTQCRLDPHKPWSPNMSSLIVFFGILFPNRNLQPF